MTRRVTRFRATVTVLALLAFLVGCGGSKSNQQTSTSASPASGGLTIDITIKGGQVTPSNATFQAKVDEPVTFKVSSDAEDELHVHSVPDHEFEVKAQANQTFPSFTIKVPGQVEVELHKLDRTVATIQVQQ
ncbi:MAG TPA: hypothetical protein VFB19_00650 [Mycobacterium sp.]|nr:hypothetical protein [Mycobacterium sp.]